MSQRSRELMIVCLEIVHTDNNCAFAFAFASMLFADELTMEPCCALK